ncbi:GLPGLI family protein [Taibaiella soli]|nr:GLPGLI family protein [Taibaiella soli]
MNRFFFYIILCSLPLMANAQYTSQGTIEFERKINVHRQFQDEENEWFERVKSQVPKFNISSFVLYFNQQQTKYKLAKELDDPAKMFGGYPAAENEVLTDFATHRVTAAKKIYEKNFLVEDSMRVIEWKITDEIRTIANYKCRKAVGKICDSVYVVAFYTDDIIVSGGPEMFSGLPGMILELAVPRLYTTWVATKVTVDPPPVNEFGAPKPPKAKKVNQKELTEALKTGFSDWGKSAARFYWWSEL